MQDDSQLRHNAASDLATALTKRTQELNVARAALGAESTRLTQAAGEVGELRQQLEIKNREVSELQKRLVHCQEVTGKYAQLECQAVTPGEDICGILSGFSAPELLGKYIRETRRVDRQSTAPRLADATLIDQVKRYVRDRLPGWQDDGNLDEGTDLRMDMGHILYYILRSNILSLMGVVDYVYHSSNPGDLRNHPPKPVNLLTSYLMSADVAGGLEDKDGSFAWYINQRLPLTYRKAPAVTTHLGKVYELLMEKKAVDARHLHLFYYQFLESHDEVFADNIRAIFTVLLLEYLHGVDSRALCIKGWDYAKNNLIAPESEDRQTVARYPTLLLDFALYFSRKPGESEAVLGGVPRVLCSSFMAERPPAGYSNAVHDILDAVDSYSRQRVYDFDNPMLYSMFKSYFLSLWNIGKYRTYLERLTRGSGQAESDLSRLYTAMKNHIVVWDLLQLWNEIRLKGIVNDVFDTGLFESVYLWNRLDPALDGRQKEDAIKGVQGAILRLHNKGGGKEPIDWTDIKKEFGDFVLRNVHTTDKVD